MCACGRRLGQRCCCLAPNIFWNNQPVRAILGLVMIVVLPPCEVCNHG